MRNKVLPLRNAAGPSPLEPRQVLQSWKEIAAYLRVTVRTVQRWEKESGLPVHRQGTGRKARVVAYADEIDNWLTNHQAGPQPEASRWIVPTIVAAAVVVILTGVILFVVFTTRPELTSVAIEATRMKVLDAKKRVVWEREFPPIGVGHYAAGNDSYRLLNVDDDADLEVLFNYAPMRSAELPGRLICFDSDGSQLWEFQYGRERVHQERRISANYLGLRLLPVQVGNRQYLLCVAGHHLWFPSQVVLLDLRTGQLLDEYWHPGGLRSVLVNDFDGDGQPEALLSGINNPGVGLGHGCLVLLDIPFGPGKKPGPGLESPFFHFTQGKELAYVLFPRPDASDVQGTLPIVEEVSVTAGKRILARVPGPEISLFYYLDYRLRLVDFRFADNLQSVHDRLWRLGLLDHKLSTSELGVLGRVRSFTTAPDGNSEEVLELMRSAAPASDHPAK